MQLIGYQMFKMGNHPAALALFGAHAAGVELILVCGTATRRDSN